MASLSTHVLDTSTGTPAPALRVELRDEQGALLAEGATDSDGRIQALGTDLGPGVYLALFHTRGYFQAKGQVGFYPKVSIEFQIDNDQHYHVPLLLAPYGFSTYRGS